MAIRIVIGAIGSGKTASIVKEMLDNPKLHYYTNIKTDLPNCTLINSNMICRKEILGVTKSGKETKKFHLNLDYWKGLKGSVNVVLDEAHSIVNSRRSMSSATQIILEWVSLLRRILGENSKGSGDLILITQLPERIDVVCRDMSRNVASYRCHYKKSCKRCGATWQEHSDFPEDIKICPACSSDDLHKHSFMIEVKHYAGMRPYEDEKFFGVKSFYKHYIVTDIEKSFTHYSTLQWENLFSDLYN
jgi:hypothetical protein